MEHFPTTLTRAQSDALVDRAEAHLAENGWGLWAVEVLGGSAQGGFAGFTGLAIPDWEGHFTPAMEVGWRLARWAWGHGNATEAARAALEFAFAHLGRTEVVSFTATVNLRSQAVMRRLGMTRDVGGDFAHPALPEGHQLSWHVLYRVSADEWHAHRRAAEAVR